MKKRRNLAFWSGFWSGITAPLGLFSDHVPPTVIQPKIVRLYRPARSSSDALRGDVHRISEDFRRSLARYDGSR